MNDDLRSTVFESLDSALDNDYLFWLAEHRDEEIAADMIECGGVPEDVDPEEVEKYVDEWKRKTGMKT